jgi:hypothetical protein
MDEEKGTQLGDEEILSTPPTYTASEGLADDADAGDSDSDSDSDSDDSDADADSDDPS